MHEHLTRAATFLRGGFLFLVRGLGEVWAWARANKKYSVPLAVGIIVALAAGGYFLNGQDSPRGADTRRSVSLVSVADVSSGEPITVIGEIRSVAEANVAPDSSGRVIRVYRSLGDYVSAGSVIAEIENASQKAALAQAEAAFDRAKSGSTLSGIGLESAVASGEAARQAAYAAINAAITLKADLSFSNPSGTSPIFYISASDSQLKNTVESGRLQLSSVLKRHASVRTAEMTESELLNELETLLSEAERTREFLANVVTLLSKSIATGNVTEAQIAGNQAEANGALSSVTPLLSSLSGASAAIRSARENQTQGRPGVSADVALAQASLDAAKAVLEKTIIRAPISGTISSIALETGNFVAAGVPAVTIVNTGGLEAVAYLSERDLPLVTVGSVARISGRADGRVSRVSPALDAATRKAEVKIAITSTDPDAPRFVAGQSATIELTPRRTETSTAIFIPVASVKITPDGAVIFIVETGGAESNTGTLVSVPVTLGALSGGKVEITSGLSLNNIIVEDARGLKNGQEVLIRGR